MASGQASDSPIHSHRSLLSSILLTVPWLLIVGLALRRRSGRTPEADDRPDLMPTTRTAWSIQPARSREAPILLMATVVFFAILGLGGSSWGEPPDTPGAKWAPWLHLVPLEPALRDEWLIWRGSASAGFGLAVVFFYRAFVAFRQFPTVPKGRRGPVPRHLVWAVFLAAAAFGFLQFAAAPARDWPQDVIPDMEARLAAVSILIGVTAVPWIALILMAQGAVMSWKKHARQSPVTARSDLGAFLQLWDLIVDCLMAFGIFVTIALLPTGALRSLWLAYAETEGAAAGEEMARSAAQAGGSGGQASEQAAQIAAERSADIAAQFPASDVLFYGMYFAIVLAVLTVPVIALWRSTSWMLIDQAYPLKSVDDVTVEWLEGRKRLEALFHLDQGLLRNPLTVFSVLTPLITATLAAFVPQIGQ